MLSTILHAVAARSRVAPVMTSGPTSGATMTSAASGDTPVRLQTSSTRPAPRARASVSAPHLLGPIGRDVLRALAAAEDAFGAARDDRLIDRIGGVERRRLLRCLDD